MLAGVYAGECSEEIGEDGEDSSKDANSGPC